MPDNFPHPSLDDLFLYQAEMAPIDDIERIEKHLLLCHQCREAISQFEKEHPEPGALDLYAIGRLNGPIGEGIKQHLSHCAWCSGTLVKRSEKVAQVRQGLNLLIGQGAAAHPEYAGIASKLTGMPPVVSEPETSERVAAEPEAEVSEPPPSRRPQFDFISLSQPRAEMPEASETPRREWPVTSKMSGFGFYSLGRRIAVVEALPSTGPAFQALSEAYDALHELMDDRDLPLPATLPAAIELSRGLREAMIQAGEESAAPAVDPERLKTEIRRFETALEDDLEKGAALPLPTQPSEELQNLVDRPDSVFPASMWSALPSAAQHHWSDAARCLAYGLPTSTAFHALRTLEFVVNLYLGRTGVPAPPRVLPEGLELLRRHGANPKAVELALHLTSLHCNPLQRPDCFVSAEEGLDQFELCTIAIKAFLRDMERRQLLER